MMQIRARVLVLLSLVLFVNVASAQSDAERAGARAAAEQGVKAFNEGRWAEAIDLMTRAEKLVHAPTHLLFVAQAEEKLGHLVAAHETYLKITREKLRTDSPEAFVSAQDAAKRAADSIRPRLSQVSVVLRGAAEKASIDVSMDGQKVPEALLGVPHPVDPGAHEFRAVGSSASSRPVSVQLREGATETVVLVLEATASGAGLGATNTDKVTNGVGTEEGRASANQPPSGKTPQKLPKAPDEPSSSMKLLGYGSLGLGVVAAGVGTVFLVQSLGKRADANALCNLSNSDCPQSKMAEVNQLDADANSSGKLATVGYAVSGVALAAGVTFLVLSPASASPRDNAGSHVTPYLGHNCAGVVGTF